MELFYYNTVHVPRISLSLISTRVDILLFKIRQPLLEPNFLQTTLYQRVSSVHNKRGLILIFFY